MACTINLREVNHELFKVIEGQNYTEAKRIVDKILNLSSVNKNDKKSIVSLILKFYIQTDDSKELDYFYNLNRNNLMRRDILSFSKYFYDLDIEKSIKSFEYLISNFKLTSDNLKYLVDNKLDRLLELLDGQYIKLDTEGYEVDYKTLKFYDFPNRVVLEALKKISRIISCPKIKSFSEKVQKYEEQKVIIDAGNVLYSKKGEITVDGYKYLLDITNHLKKIGKIPIIIIHARHMKKTFKGCQKSKDVIDIIENLNDINREFIFETPYNVNDDYFILYSSLFLRSKIITNDNFRDHIYSFRTNKKEDDFNSFENFMDDLLIKYNYNGRDIGINSSDFCCFSNCIQVDNETIIIPTRNNKFVKYKLN